MKGLLKSHKLTSMRLLQSLYTCDCVYQWFVYERTAWLFPTTAMLQALSDAHNFLFEERQRLLTLQAENDALRLQV